jgi:hypothetical protein
VNWAQYKLKIEGAIVREKSTQLATFADLVAYGLTAGKEGESNDPWDVKQTEVFHEHFVIKSYVYPQRSGGNVLLIGSPFQ